MKTADMKELDGKQGEEIGFVFENMFFSPNQLEEMLSCYSPKTAKKIRSRVHAAKLTWTYEFGYAKFTNLPAIYKQNFQTVFIQEK